MCLALAQSPEAETLRGVNSLLVITPTAKTHQRLMIRNLLLFFLFCAVTGVVYSQGALDKFKLNDTLNPLYIAMTQKLACKYAIKKQYDSSLFFINEFRSQMNKGYKKEGIIMLLASPEINANLYDKRWVAMRDSMIRELKTYYSSQFNTSVFIQLLQFDMEDQNLRWLAVSPSQSNKSFANSAVTLSQKHLKFIDSLLAQHVILDTNTVGKEGMHSLWLLIHHGVEKTNLNKYAEQMKSWYNSGEIEGGDYALYLDRVRITQGKPQIYGSQYMTDEKANQLILYPIESIANVNVLRKQMRMKSIQYYLVNVEFFEKKKFRKDSVEGILKGNENMQDLISKEMNN